MPVRGLFCSGEEPSKLDGFHAWRLQDFEDGRFVEIAKHIENIFSHLLTAQARLEPGRERLRAIQTRLGAVKRHCMDVMLDVGVFAQLQEDVELEGFVNRFQNLEA